MATVVVMDTESRQLFMNLSPSPLKIHHGGGLMYVKSVMAQSPHVGVVGKSFQLSFENKRVLVLLPKNSNEIRGSRVGRNQTTIMPICDRWMQEGTTDRRGRLHPPQCNSSREDRQIVRMAVTDCSVTSRTVAQHIESVTHHSVSARTIRRHLQQSGLSARGLFLGLPFTQNQ
ncbi:transposable element Tcb1 transposase [Trichonephila clavipes]|nr:transposable element Tcb1 transposase [Trichonephila clavipes]